MTAECAVPARRAYAYLADGLAVGGWALGSFGGRKVGPNLFRGRSLFDGAPVLYRPVGDAARLTVDYHVGTDPQALLPRVMARAVPGEATGRDRGSCLVTLVAWRDAAMTDARWERLVACHEVEIRLIQARLQQSVHRLTSPAVGRRRRDGGVGTDRTTVDLADRRAPEPRRRRSGGRSKDTT